MTNHPPTLFSGNGKVVVEQEISIKDFVYKYFLYNWYLYIIFAGLGIALAYAYLKYSTPVYEVTSKLLIKEDKNKSFAPGDKLLKDLNLFGASENVANEVQIINSFSIMEQVVEELNLAVLYGYKYWIKPIPSYQSFPILVDTFALSPYALASEEYNSPGGINLEIRPIDYQRFRLLNGEDYVGIYKFEELVNNKFGTFKFLAKPPINFVSDSSMHISFITPELVIRDYLENLKIDLTNIEATIIQLKLKEALPQKGVDILNKLIEIYNTQTIAHKNKISRNSLKFIDERLDAITKDLTIVEGNIEQFKRRNEITSTASSDLEIMFKEMSKYMEEQTNLEVQLSILKSMDSFLSNPNEFELIPANLSVANTALTTSVEAYNKLVLTRHKLLETAQPSNPLILSSEQQLRSLMAIIRTTVSNIEKDFRKKLSSVRGVNRDLTGRLRIAPTKERGLLEIKRQQVVKEKLYLFLLQKREETALSLVATTANSRTVDIPRFEMKPIAPRRTLVYLGGLLAGLFFPFMLIVGKDIFQTSIQKEEDIKVLTNVSIIGAINKVKRNIYIAVARNSRTAIAERFRLLRTNLQFLGKKNRQQTILVTSSVSGEGKTFVSVNLALSFALTNQKTILLGMDLRKPKMKEYLGVKQHKEGIAAFLAGRAELTDIIHQFKDEPNLDYIACGTPPMNPHELLLEDTVSSFFAQLKQKYDIIIIDTAPVGLVSDAILLKEHVTETIYVVRANVTQRNMLENANNLFLQKKLQNCSILFNGVNMNRGYGYQRYGYGKKYGYYQT